MTQLNLKLIEIVPEKIIIVNGKQYLILDDVTIKNTKPNGGRSITADAEATDRRAKILDIIRRNPGIKKTGVIEAMEREHGVNLAESFWNAAQTKLQKEGKIRAERINGTDKFSGNRYYFVSPIDPELERLLAEEEEIERQALGPFGSRV